MCNYLQESIIIRVWQRFKGISRCGFLKMKASYA